MQKFTLGVRALILLLPISAYAATPDELYQSWQVNSRRQPDVAEKAAEDYLHLAPAGPYAHDLQIWLDAYHKALAGLPSLARKGAPANNRAVAQPAHPRQPNVPPPEPQVASNAAPNNAPPAAPPVQPQQFNVPAPAPRVASNAAPNNAHPAAPPVQPQQLNVPTPEPRVASNAPPDNAHPVARPVQPEQFNVPAPAPRVASNAPSDNAHPVAPPPHQPSPEAAGGRPMPAVPWDNNGPKNQPPKAAQDTASGAAGQSLEETLAFIADKVDGQGQINFSALFHNPANNHDLIEQLSYQASNVTIDPNRCQISFRWHVDQDGKGSPDQERVFQPLLAMSIKVETLDQALGDINAAAGHPFSVRVHPEVYAVHMARADNPSGNNLYFHDEDMATQVGKAAQHAVDLCSGRPRGARSAR